MTEHYIIYEDEEVDVETALINGYININDVLNSDAPFVMVEDFINENPVSADEETVGSIGEYSIIRSVEVCDNMVGNIYVDGYNFGYFDNQCSFDLNSIGYYAVRSDQYYEIQNLVNDGILTTKQVFELYRTDEGRMGDFDFELVLTD